MHAFMISALQSLRYAPLLHSPVPPADLPSSKLGCRIHGPPVPDATMTAAYMIPYMTGFGWFSCSPPCATMELFVDFMDLTEEPLFYLGFQTIQQQVK